ncbi:MAG: PEGA domain-containing protein [Lentisphaerae bacterium]|nr:PEGA domain-containing protein [Lentisphaerota bacterium]
MKPTGKTYKTEDTFLKVLRVFVSIFILGTITALMAAPATGLIELKLTSEPSGAAVIIDKAAAGATPLATTVEPGNHLIEVKSANYEPYVMNVNATGMPLAEHITLVPVTSCVLIKSTPPGAKITLDGSSIGETPRLLPELQIGSYRVEMSLEGYKPQRLDLNVTSGRPQRLNIELASSSATLDVTSEPIGAEVTVNGILRGTTPVTVEKIPEGSSTVIVTAEGYETYQEQVSLEAGDKFTLHTPLKPIPAKLTVITIPEGARVYVNNEFKGESPVTLENLTSGTYRLRVEKESHEILARKVILGNNQASTEKLRLTAKVRGLILETSPAGVTVLAGGKELGTTIAEEDKTDQISEPLELQNIPIGRQEIVFFKKGYAEEKRTIEIKRDEIVTLETVALRRQFIRDVEITTKNAVYKGVFVDKNDEIYRIETEPGVIRSFFNQDIKGIRLIREENIIEDITGHED